MAWKTRIAWLSWIGCLALVCAAVASACGGSSAAPGYSVRPDGGGAADTGTNVLGADAGGGETGSTLGNNQDSGPPQGTVPPLSMEACQACTAAGGTCANNMCTLTDNPGSLSTTVQGQLKAGGNGDSRFAWLYPYDQTIFPHGLLPPTLQFDGTAPDALYVHVSFSEFDYQGYYGKSSPGRLTMSQLVWTALTLSANAPVKVEVTKLSGGSVSGPITETWGIAHGSLRGTIYYETYNSTLAGGLGGVGIMQIQPGASTPKVVRSGCGNVCHTASADGSTLVANTAFPAGSASYDLKNNAATMMAEADDRFTYGGLYPDGSFAMSATNYRTWLDTASGLFDTKTGANIPAPGWDGVVRNCGTAAFSPDGKYIAFNHEDTGGGHTLALMNFDLATHGFSGLVDVVTDPSTTLAWPAFTPDSQWIVYHAGSNAAFETDEGATGDISIVNRMTHTTHRLSALDGYTGSGSQTYLPAQDPGLSFAPTVLPEAVGGYFWVVFTSHRSYGNTLASMASDGQDADDLGKLWVAAMDIPPTGGEFPPTVTDPSHPAFYLDGQESQADNLRGFWVLNPCKADGSGCQSGDDCCGGYCQGGEGGMPVCSSMAGGCSNEFDKCTTSSDCCNSTLQCIAGRCAQTTPQ
jgi:hypothetical protein